MSKYVFVTGGCYSGCGKGISTSSLALLMKSRGFTVNYLKCDPYLNINAGILRPSEHGEVFLCDDGSEVDLDLGSVERHVSITTSKDNICTSGTIHKELIEEQTKGDYLGQTIQLVPHFVNKVIARFEKLGKESDIVFVEIGGTVGDNESFSFYEAIRQFKQSNYNDVITVMVAPIIWVDTVGEHKTKPMQNAVRELQKHGIHPDILLCRSSKEVPDKIIDKISRTTGVDKEGLFLASDVRSIYEVPIQFYNQHIDDFIVDKFHLKRSVCRIHKYKDSVEKYLNEDLPQINIGIFGKYDGEEAYLSLKEAIYHAAVSNNVRVNINWIKSEELENKRDISSYFKDIDGIIIPGGFDSRGVDGKIKAIRYARENKIPFLGICLGLQCAVIEFAKNVCKLKNANSKEFDKDCENPVVHYIEGQEDIENKSGTMRLGAYACKLKKGSLTAELYSTRNIEERHRHRLEVNDEYVDKFEDKGFYVVGRNPDSNLIEIMEMDREIHPYFIGTQAHPEFKSRLLDPAPLFNGLIKEACNYSENRNSK